MNVSVSNMDSDSLFDLCSQPDFLVCGHCNKQFPFSSLSAFIQHKKFDCDDLAARLGLSKSLQCWSCSDVFTSPWSLIQHAQAAHSVQIYRPASPTTTFTSPQTTQLSATPDKTPQTHDTSHDNPNVSDLQQSVVKDTVDHSLDPLGNASVQQMICDILSKTTPTCTDDHCNLTPGKQIPHQQQHTDTCSNHSVGSQDTAPASSSTNNAPNHTLTCNNNLVLASCNNGGSAHHHHYSYQHCHQPQHQHLDGCSLNAVIPNNSIHVGQHCHSAVAHHQHISHCPTVVPCTQATHTHQSLVGNATGAGADTGGSSSGGAGGGGGGSTTYHVPHGPHHHHLPGATTANSSSQPHSSGAHFHCNATSLQQNAVSGSASSQYHCLLADSSKTCLNADITNNPSKAYQQIFASIVNDADRIQRASTHSCNDNIEPIKKPSSSTCKTVSSGKAMNIPANVPSKYPTLSTIDQLSLNDSFTNDTSVDTPVNSSSTTTANMSNTAYKQLDEYIHDCTNNPTSVEYQDVPDTTITTTTSSKLAKKTATCKSKGKVFPPSFLGMNETQTPKDKSKEDHDTCNNEDCGINVMPGTHEKLKKCCNAVVPKKRKRHMETKHCKQKKLRSTIHTRRTRFNSNSSSASKEESNVVVVIQDTDVDFSTDVQMSGKHAKPSSSTSTVNEAEWGSTIDSSTINVTTYPPAETTQNESSLSPRNVLRTNARSSSRDLPILHICDSSGNNDDKCKPRSATYENVLSKKAATTPGDMPSTSATLAHDGHYIKQVGHRKRRYPTSKPFKCDQCSMSFNQRIHLTKHQQSKHTGIKPFKCDHCDYSTVERSHLKVHVRIHTGEKPFKCPYCEYATAQNSTVKIHIKRHHPEKSPQVSASATSTKASRKREAVMQRGLDLANLHCPLLARAEPVALYRVSPNFVKRENSNDTANDLDDTGMNSSAAGDGLSTTSSTASVTLGKLIHNEMVMSAQKANKGGNTQTSQQQPSAAGPNAYDDQISVSDIVIGYTMEK